MCSRMRKCTCNSGFLFSHFHKPSIKEFMHNNVWKYHWNEGSFWFSFNCSSFTGVYKGMYVT